MDFKKAAQNVIKAIGTVDNIVDVTHCITRLRLKVGDVSLINKKELNSIDGNLGLVENGNEIHIVFGPKNVNLVYTELVQIFNNSNASFSDTIKAEKEKAQAYKVSVLKDFLAKFSKIFVPLIPGFIGAGMLAGLVGLLKEMHITGDLVAYLSIFNKSLVMFMYIMIGHNAAKAFGGTGVLGGILAGLFLMKYNLPNSVIHDFFGITIQPRGGIVGILISAIISANLEQKIRKYFSWAATDIITTPVLTMVIMGALVYAVIMPLSYQLFQVMNYAFVSLNGSPIGAGILAGLFLPSVMMGIHQGFVPVYQSLVETTGMNSLFPILAMAGAGQVGASLALYFKTDKDSNLRKNIRGAIIPGFLGIGEPLIYGVTLPRVKPFFTSMLGGAVGGIYIGLLAKMGFSFGLNTLFGSSGLLASIAMVSPHGVVVAMMEYISALIVSYIAGFILTWFFGTKNIDLS